MLQPGRTSLSVMSIESDLLKDADFSITLFATLPKTSHTRSTFVWEISLAFYHSNMSVVGADCFWTFGL